MITQNRGTIAFAVCGSFCTLEAALQSARALTAQGWQLLPVMSFAARQDTRFGTGNYWKEQLEAAAGHPVLDTLQAVEPLGPRKMAQALVVQVLWMIPELLSFLSVSGLNCSTLRLRLRLA